MAARGAATTTCSTLDFVMIPLYMGKRVTSVKVTGVPPHRNHERVIAMMVEHGEVISLKATPQEGKSGLSMEF